MKIQVVLYASLAHLLPPGSKGNSCALEIKEGTTVGDLLTMLGISLDTPKIIFLNGRHTEYSGLLNDDDRLAVFPPIAGG